jgi:hypothetical protein
MIEKMKIVLICVMTFSILVFNSIIANNLINRSKPNYEYWDYYVEVKYDAHNQLFFVKDYLDIRENSIKIEDVQEDNITTVLLKTNVFVRRQHSQHNFFEIINEGKPITIYRLEELDLTFIYVIKVKDIHNFEFQIRS